jgi:hypothetical protein
VSRDSSTVTAYVRALEGALSRSADRPVVISSRDWHLATDWHDRGIPLGLVLDVLTECSGKTVRSLAYLAPRVEEAWSVVISGRTMPRAADPEEVGGDPPSAFEQWRQALSGDMIESALRESILDLLDRGAPPDEIERLLEDRLLDTIPREFLEEMERESRENLEPYRARMSRDIFEATVQRSVLGRIRRRLRLPRLDS